MANVYQYKSVSFPFWLGETVYAIRIGGKTPEIVEFNIKTITIEMNGDELQYSINYGEITLKESIVYRVLFRTREAAEKELAVARGELGED